MPRNASSAVWKTFRLSHSNPDKAVCLKCHRWLAYSSNSTSTLHKHCRSFHSDKDDADAGAARPKTSAASRRKAGGGQPPPSQEQRSEVQHNYERGTETCLGKSLGWHLTKTKGGPDLPLSFQGQTMTDSWDNSSYRYNQAGGGSSTSGGGRGRGGEASSYTQFPDNGGGSNYNGGMQPSRRKGGRSTTSGATNGPRKRGRPAKHPKKDEGSSPGSSGMSSNQTLPSTESRWVVSGNEISILLIYIPLLTPLTCLPVCPHSHLLQQCHHKPPSSQSRRLRATVVTLGIMTKTHLHHHPLYLHPISLAKAVVLALDATVLNYHQ